MALIIPQGKQDTTQDNKFNPIVATNVVLEITELKLATTQTNTLEVTLRVLEGPHKNRFIFDRVQYCKTDAYDGTWKYRQLRACAGVPYQDNEPTSIDIEALLLHKAVKADLGIRKGKNKDGEDTEYQDVKYKMMTAPQVDMPNTPEAVPVKPKAKTVAAQVAQPTPVAPTNSVVKDDPLPFETPALNITDEDDWN